MARQVVAAAMLSLLLLATSAAVPTQAGDREDCYIIKTLVETYPARVVGACRRLADQGESLAQNNLGSLYYRGKGVPWDYAEAAKWYNKAADQGDSLAQNNLGFLYYSGRGLRQDYAEAARWFRKAADQDNPDAQTSLGVLYINGQGVPKDDVQAYMWWTLAANKGDANAVKNRDRLATLLTPAQIEQAKALAAAWKPATGQ
jgi:uncharacterized protein